MFLLGWTLWVGQADGATLATLENPNESAYQEDLEMSLWADGAPGALGAEPKDMPKITVRKVASEKPTGALIICPGGGYGGLAMDHEGKQMVQWANSIGLTAVLCDYRHRGKGYGHPAPLQDAQRAVRTVRAKAAEWRRAFGIDRHHPVRFRRQKLLGSNRLAILTTRLCHSVLSGYLDGQ